jgi:hypothetical protein
MLQHAAKGVALVSLYITVLPGVPCYSKRMHVSFSLFHEHRARMGFLLILGGVIGSLAGCGYTLVGASPHTSAWRVVLAVVPFTNQTYEPELEGYMTAALRRALVQSQAFDLASEAKTLRRLQGTVRRFRVIPVSFDANDNVLQYRIEAGVLIRLVEGESQGTTLEQEISAWAEYLISETNAVRENVVAKQAALFRLAQQFASKCTALLTVALL